MLPHRRRSVEETQDLIRAELMVEVLTRKIGEVFKELDRMSLSQTIDSRLVCIAQVEIITRHKGISELLAFMELPLTIWFYVYSTNHLSGVTKS